MRIFIGVYVSAAGLLDEGFVGLKNTLYSMSKQRCVQALHGTLFVFNPRKAPCPRGLKFRADCTAAGCGDSAARCVFVGVQTGMSNSSVVEPRYNYTLRRAMLQATWFPRTQQNRHRCGSVPLVTAIAGFSACRQQRCPFAAASCCCCGRHASSPRPYCLLLLCALQTRVRARHRAEVCCWQHVRSSSGGGTVGGTDTTRGHPAPACAGVWEGACF